jgi:tetratricopeptide (TPR) repeat protein
MARLAALILLSLLAFGQDTVDPLLRSAVEQFFAMQEAEDANGYLALWSKSANRPQLHSLKFIFDTGDDKFLDLEITRAAVTGDTARVRVSVTRVRSLPANPKPDGSPRYFTSRLNLALTYVREDGAWKLLREGTPADEMARALIDAPDAAARARLLETDPALVTTRLVDAVGRIADEFTVKLEYKPAQRVYEVALEVARAAKDRKAEGQMLQNVANSHYFQRNYPLALSTYESRLALEREEANDEGMASALVGIATIKYSTQEYGEALKIYREALAIQERVGDQALVSTTLLSVGNVLYLQGDYQGAIAEYRRAETLKRRFFDLAGAAVALEGLGRTYAAQGDYAAALVAFGTVLADSRKRMDTARQGSALQNMGDVHTRLANLDAARAAYEESRAIFEARKDVGQAGRALQGTGIVELLSGRLAQAEAAYERSLALCGSRAPMPDEPCVAQALVGLGFAQASLEKWDASIASYQKGVRAFLALKASDGAARAQVGLAEAFSGKEEYVRALEEAGGARHTAIALDADDILWRALVSQSRAQRRLKRPADALGAVRAAVLAVRRLATAAAAKPATAPPRDGTAAYAAAAVLHAEAGDAASAWNTAEEMRAHALRAALATNERELAPGMTDEERTAERAAAAEIHPLLAQQEREKGLPKPDAARLKKLEAAIAAATDKRNAWQKTLFARLPHLPVWRGLAPAAGVDDFGPLVSDGDLWLQFVIDDHDLVVLTAARADDKVILGAHVVPLKRQQLAEAVAKTLEPSTVGEAALWRKTAAELVHKMLPSPVIDQLSSARKVVVIPDDMLWRLPFEALPVGERYLADIADVRYAASMTSLVREPAATSAPPAFAVGLVNAPQLPASVVETLKTTAPSWVLRVPDTAQVETQRILGVLDADVDTLTGTAATEEAFRALAASSSVLHLTGPFRVNAASPLFSPALLAEAAIDAQTPARDGIFEAREASTAGLSARVLVISDPAALSMRDAAAALPTLRWAWRAGGVDTVVTRRWASDETYSGDVLSAFYAALHDGMPAVDAMRQARDAVRKANPELPPAAWAGWIVLGGR